MNLDKIIYKQGYDSHSHGYTKYDNPHCDDPYYYDVWESGRQAAESEAIMLQRAQNIEYNEEYSFDSTMSEDEVREKF